MKTKIGGDRLGSGSKQEISLKTYSRSTHDLSYIWRSSMASGTLVPFMSEIGLPGDSFDINLDCDVLTLPTIGPLFGSYKVQLDVFACPIRLYNGKLHMNKLGIGLDMAQIKLPQLIVKAGYNSTATDDRNDNEQINPSCILSYLNMRGLGRSGALGYSVLTREFNAVPYLSYWDIYKNYYANKQEERGFVIHNALINEGTIEIISVIVGNGLAPTGNIYGGQIVINYSAYQNGWITYRVPAGTDVNNINLKSAVVTFGGTTTVLTSDAFDDVAWIQEPTETTDGTFQFTNYNGGFDPHDTAFSTVLIGTKIQEKDINKSAPILVEFDLDNIDTMREDILADVKNNARFKIEDTTISPYGLCLKPSLQIAEAWSKQSNQEGLAIKTYQSDLFNNWISTEWIDGANGINEVTKVDTTGGDFTIDALNLANKVYNMLNRIAISGGSYDDWLDAVYTHDRARSVESPVYQGSLIRELSFQEVVSTAEAGADTDQPLGTLAGKGRLTQKNKGGKIKVKIDEPSYILGIASITPRVDYSQGNKWDVNLKTLDDLHKPALDEIGFQDLITDQMAWFDSLFTDSNTVTFNSAGKQPAWINYMTNVNQTRGNFAIKEKDMFMTLNRRYDIGNNTGIDDLTTYIDPTKFNHIFAETEIDAQNFWVQISNKITARRKMSAKVIPNL